MGKLLSLGWTVTETWNRESSSFCGWVLTIGVNDLLTFLSPIISRSMTSALRFCAVLRGLGILVLMSMMKRSFLHACSIKIMVDVSKVLEVRKQGGEGARRRRCEVKKVQKGAK